MRGPDPTRGRKGPRPIEIVSTPAAIDTARAWLRRACAGRPRLDERWIDELELALVEALANVIEHAYDRAPDRPIHLGLRFFADRAELRIEDDGRAFPGFDEPPPLPPESADGGRGLFLMHALTDRVRHTRDATGRNRVCLTKNFADRNGAFGGRT